MMRSDIALHIFNVQYLTYSNTNTLVSPQEESFALPMNLRPPQSIQWRQLNVENLLISFLASTQCRKSFNFVPGPDADPRYIATEIY